MRSSEHPFQYAVLRVVPDAERRECINVGVIMLARTLDFLGMKAQLDRNRLRALSATVDAAEVEKQLVNLRRIADGAEGAGLMARLPLHERFHWLTAPSSTVLQPSELHTGLCSDPGVTLQSLFSRLVQ